MKIRFITLAAVTLLLAGCGDSKGSYKPVPTKDVPPATVASGEELSLFPLAVGNKWVFDLKSTQLTQAGALPQAAEFTLSVAKVDDLGGGSKRATIDVFKGEVQTDRQIWRIDKNGIFQEQTGLTEALRPEPAQIAIAFPIEKDKVTKWSGKAPTGQTKGTMQQMTQEIVTKQPEDVDTILGPISAYRVENTQTYIDKQGNQWITKAVAWWAPKIGLVRNKQDVRVIPKATGKPVNVQTQQMVLKQHTVK